MFAIDLVLSIHFGHGFPLGVFLRFKVNGLPGFDRRVYLIY